MWYVSTSLVKSSFIYLKIIPEKKLCIMTSIDEVIFANFLFPNLEIH